MMKIKPSKPAFDFYYIIIYYFILYYYKNFVILFIIIHINEVILFLTQEYY